MPTTFLQVCLIVVAVLPGATYQFTRERGGAALSPQHSELSERILRALAASLVLDIAYVLVFGDTLTGRLPLSASHWEELSASPRAAALLALVLLIAVPAAAAWAVSRLERGRQPTQYLATPSAWDHLFAGLGSCFIRARLKSGHWVGGWYGSRSYASSHPAAAHDLYLEAAWHLTPSGAFESRVQQTEGLYIRLDDIELLEILSPEQR